MNQTPAVSSASENRPAAFFTIYSHNYGLDESNRCNFFYLVGLYL
jgi:hypothetical protein